MQSRADPDILDALIVGGGPAGLSAALALGRINRRALLFDSGVYRNQGVTAMHTVLANDGANPQNFRAAARDQLRAKYHSIRMLNATVTDVARVSLGRENYNGFRATLHDGQVFLGRKLILATGTEDILPANIPGYKENWPSHIYQCLFCDGFEHKGKTIGILGFPSPAYLSLGLMALQFSPTVTIFANGIANSSSDPVLQTALDTALAAGMTLDTRRISQLINNGDVGITIAFEDNSTVQLGMLLDKPSTRTRSNHLIGQLALDTMGPTGEVKVDPLFGEASVSGVFVPGDAGQMLKQVAVAMGTGVRAASGVSYQLCNEEGARALAKSKGNITAS